MSTTKHSDYKALATAVVDILADAVQSPVVIVNVDDMNGCVCEISASGECTVKDTYEGVPKSDFYQAASVKYLGDEKYADALFNVCAASKKTLLRHIRSDRQSDDALGEIKDCGKTVGCKELTAFYESEYAGRIKELAETVRSKAAEDAVVVLVGKLAAFYPAEHTVKETMTPMPFLPLPQLIVAERTAVDPKELMELGRRIIERFEEAQKRLAHNVMLQFKRFTGTGLADWLFILAKKGENYSSLETPKYSETVIVHANDPLMVFADSTPYSIKLPRTAFPRGSVTCKAQFALGLEGDVPKLFIKTDVGQVTLDIDSKIYAEG